MSAIVEVAPTLDGHIPVHLVQLAYRASRTMSVVLALRAVDIRALDRVLDSIVLAGPLDVPGVRYVDVSDERALRALHDSGPEFVVASTDAFRSQWADAGIPCLEPDEAVSRLECAARLM